MLGSKQKVELTKALREEFGGMARGLGYYLNMAEWLDKWFTREYTWTNEPSKEDNVTD